MYCAIRIGIVNINNDIQHYCLSEMSLNQLLAIYVLD